jgi:hypothetical protein
MVFFTFNKLPDPIKEELWRTDIYPRRLLVEVARQKSRAMMLFLFNQIKNNKLNSEQVREMTRTPKNDAPGMEHNLPFDEYSCGGRKIHCADVREIVTVYPNVAFHRQVNMLPKLYNCGFFINLVRHMGIHVK